MTVELIGSINHPKYGKYYLLYSTELGTYGISKTEYNGENGMWCACASLAELFKRKGI